MRRVLCILAAATVLATGDAEAQFGQPQIPATIRAEMQVVSVSPEDARALVPVFQNRQTAAEGWNRVQAMLADERATLIDWPIMWLQNGQRGVAENIVEYRHARDFNIMANPIPQNFEYTPPLIPIVPMGPYTPGEFETRNGGVTFEMEPTLEKNGKVLLLNMVPQLVRLVNVHEWHIQKLPIGAEGRMQRPEFQVSRITTTLRLHPDEPVLIGYFPISDPAPHVNLFILRARVTMLPPGTKFPPTIWERTKQ